MKRLKNFNSILILVVSLGIFNSCSSQNKTNAQAEAMAGVSPAIEAMPADTAARHETFLRNNWMNLIHIKKSRSYKTGRGHIGIFGLKAEVENTLDYKIDSVKILVPYYSRGECIQSVVVWIRNIPPHSQRTVRVTDNASATSYQMQVRKVNSSALQLCFDIDDPNRQGDDPYKCK